MSIANTNISDILSTVHTEYVVRTKQPTRSAGVGNDHRALAVSLGHWPSKGPFFPYIVLVFLFLFLRQVCLGQDWPRLEVMALPHKAF